MMSPCTQRFNTQRSTHNFISILYFNKDFKPFI